MKLRTEPDLSGLSPGPRNPCFQSQFFIGSRILSISSANPTERVLYLHIIYKRTIDVEKKNQRKVECISQIFRLFLYKVLSFYLFSDLTRHFTGFIFMFHNGRLAVIFLFTERQTRIRHIPQCCFLLLKEMISTSLKN